MDTGIDSGFVVEIGSNDGYLSEQFKKNGFSVLGVDPSPYMANLAKERGIDTIVDLFSTNVAKKISENYKKADIVTANNVYNHSDNPLDFTKAVSQILSNEGVLQIQALREDLFLLKMQRKFLVMLI